MAGLHELTFLEYFDTTTVRAEDVYALGIDIGGSGIKGALVNLKKGSVATERFQKKKLYSSISSLIFFYSPKKMKRHRIPTPQPSTTEACLKVLEEIVEHFNWRGKPVGVTFPGVVKQGIIYTAANVDKSWVEFDLPKHLKQRTECDVVVLNDADAAGVAEMTYGAGKGSVGVTFIITLGTVTTKLFLFQQFENYASN